MNGEFQGGMGQLIIVVWHTTQVWTVEIVEENDAMTDAESDADKDWYSQLVLGLGCRSGVDLFLWSFDPTKSE